jgi:hypothetical protein
MPLTGITERARRERMSAIRTELLARLRPVCQGMPPEQFSEMVENMAALQLKYELQGVESVGGR